MGFLEFHTKDTRTDDERLGKKVQANTLKILHCGCARKPMPSDGARQRLRQKRSMDLLCCTKEIEIMFAKQPKNWRHPYEMLLIE